MRLIVLFDLPTKSKKDKKNYINFRKLLISSGFSMIQYSVYMRECEWQYSVKTYERLVIDNIPLNGSVRIITLTDEQYKNMKVYIGKKIDKNEEIYGKQLLLF